MMRHATVVLLLLMLTMMLLPMPLHAGTDGNSTSTFLLSILEEILQFLADLLRADGPVPDPPPPT